MKGGTIIEEAKKVILIAIIDYPLELTQTISEMETVWKLCEKNHPNLVLTDSIEICILELDKVKNTYYKNKLDKKAQWMLFLDDPNCREVKEIMEKNNDIKDAVIEVHERSKDEQLRRLAELKEKAIMDEKAIYKAGRLRGEKEGIQKGLQEGVQKGIQKGITQGQLEKSIEIIKNLYSMNLTISQISQAVDMSEQEVQKIIDKFIILFITINYKLQYVKRTTILQIVLLFFINFTFSYLFLFIFHSYFIVFNASLVIFSLSNF